MWEVDGIFLGVEFWWGGEEWDKIMSICVLGEVHEVTQTNARMRLFGLWQLGDGRRNQNLTYLQDKQVYLQ